MSDTRPLKLPPLPPSPRCKSIASSAQYGPMTFVKPPIRCKSVKECESLISLVPPGTGG